jgi:nucleotide-binding universal stress UspA family protein
MFSRVLVAVDGGELTERVMTYALGLSDHPDLHFICAVDPEHFFSDATEVVFDAVGEHAAAIESAQRLVDRCVASATKAGSSATGHVVKQSPAEAILDTAKLVGADLIVMATHGRNGLIRAVLGSVAETVARQADVGVLLVPSHLAAFATSS